MQNVKAVIKQYYIKYYIKNNIKKYIIKFLSISLLKIKLYV